MHRREVPKLAIVLAMFLLGSCGSSSTNEEARAARGRASLIATFTKTSYKLPPAASPSCVEDRQNRTSPVDSDEPDIYCSLNSDVMRHLLGRLDQGLGTDVTATQRSCINRTITRDQIAALLSAELGAGRDREATVARFDDQLASGIRQCINN